MVEKLPSSTVMRWRKLLTSPPREGSPWKTSTIYVCGVEEYRIWLLQCPKCALPEMSLTRRDALLRDETLAVSASRGFDTHVPSLSVIANNVRALHATANRTFSTPAMRYGTTAGLFLSFLYCNPPMLRHALLGLALRSAKERSALLTLVLGALVGPELQRRDTRGSEHLLQPPSRMCFGHASPPSLRLPQGSMRHSSRGNIRYRDGGPHVHLCTFRFPPRSTAQHLCDTFRPTSM